MAITDGRIKVHGGDLVVSASSNRLTCKTLIFYMKDICWFYIYIKGVNVEGVLKAKKNETSCNYSPDGAHVQPISDHRPVTSAGAQQSKVVIADKNKDETCSYRFLPLCGFVCSSFFGRDTCVCINENVFKNRSNVCSGAQLTDIAE